MIENLKDLEKFLKLCRRQGVVETTLDGMSFKLGDLPQEQSKAAEVEIDQDDPYANFPPGMLSPEQLAFYSSGGTPETDPHRTDQ